MKKGWIYLISLISLCIIWYLMYVIIGHDLVLPSPINVFQRFFEILFSLKAITIIGHTLLRLFLAIFISASIGIFCAL